MIKLHETFLNRPAFSVHIALECLNYRNNQCSLFKFAPNTDSEHLARIVDKREDDWHFNNSIKKPQTWLCITFAVRININQTFYYCEILGLLKVVKTDRSNLITFLYLINQKSERIWILYNSRQIYKNVTNIFE